MSVFQGALQCNVSPNVSRHATWCDKGVPDQWCRGANSRLSGGSACSLARAALSSPAGQEHLWHWLLPAAQYRQATPQLLLMLQSVFVTVVVFVTTALLVPLQSKCSDWSPMYLSLHCDCLFGVCVLTVISCCTLIPLSTHHHECYCYCIADQHQLQASHVAPRLLHSVAGGVA